MQIIIQARFSPKRLRKVLKMKANLVEYDSKYQ